jgi:hypothetical protein
VIERPKIHESVFKRIVAARDDYAPIVLPKTYDIVAGNGTIIDNGNNPYEHTTQAAARCADQERVWNRVWFRRVLYFSTVGVTLAIVLTPLLFKGVAIGDIDRRSGAITAAIHLAGTFLPEMLRPITTFWEGHPVVFAALAVFLVVLFVLGTIMQRSIADGMRGLWDGILRKGPHEVDAPVFPSDPLYRIRSHRAYREFCEFMSQHVFPLVFGLAALAVVVLLVVGTVNRAAFAAESVAGWTCTEVTHDRLVEDGAPVRLVFDNTQLCQSTDVLLTSGTTYDVTIELSPDWRDAQNEADLTGVTSAQRPWVYVVALPFRRMLTRDWFVPVARIGRKSAEYHTLATPTTQVVPRQSGHLYLFVNDAIGVRPWRNVFYDNNHGTATVTVSKRSGPGKTE